MINFMEISFKEEVRVNEIVEALILYLNLDSGQIVQMDKFYESIGEDNILIGLEAEYSKKGYKTFIKLHSKIDLPLKEKVYLMQKLSDKFSTEIAIPEDISEYEDSLIVISPGRKLCSGIDVSYQDKESCELVFDVEKKNSISIEELT